VHKLILAEHKHQQWLLLLLLLLLLPEIIPLPAHS
jgi:hypothetical protein